MSDTDTTDTAFSRFLLEQYQTAALRFLEFCTDTLGLSDADGKLKSTLQESPRDVVSRWHADMSKELDRGVKYARAVERILGCAPQAYLACEYRDMDSLYASTAVDFFDRLLLPACYADGDKCPSESKKIVWGFVRELNRQVHLLHESEPQIAPTRDQIQKNISERREQRRNQSNAPSMGRAFHTSLLALARNIGSESYETHLNSLSAEQQEEALEAWKQLLNDAPDLEGACQRGDVDALVAFEWTVLGEQDRIRFREALEGSHAHSVLDALNQIVSYCKVQSKIPTQMMGRIEDYAQKLAMDITSGNASLANLDLNRIGEEVLSGCNPEDMNALAENIGGLLPTLTHLKGQIPDALQSQLSK